MIVRSLLMMLPQFCCPWRGSVIPRFGVTVWADRGTAIIIQTNHLSQRIFFSSFLKVRQLKITHEKHSGLVVGAVVVTVNEVPAVLALMETSVGVVLHVTLSVDPSDESVVSMI
jgi:hypothetical protein